MALVAPHGKPLVCWKNLRCIVVVRLRESSRECLRPWAEARLHLRSLRVVIRRSFVEKVASADLCGGLPVYPCEYLGFEAISQGMISNDAILSPSSLKKNRRSTGLPGKFPTRCSRSLFASRDSVPLSPRGVIFR